MAIPFQAKHESLRGNFHDNAPMEQLFRSPKTEWIPTVGYMIAALAHKDIGRFLMQCYNWQRPHEFNSGLPPAVAEEKLNAVSGNSSPLQAELDRV